MLSNIYIHSRAAMIEQRLIHREAERQALIAEALRTRRPAGAKRSLQLPRVAINRLANPLRPLRSALRVRSSST